jgi:anti-sigma factor RsiW
MTMHTANGHDEAADLPALAAGTLTPEARARAEAHLAGCAACRAELAAWHAVTAATGHLAEAVAEPSPDVLAGALARIEPRTPARRPRRWAVRVPRAWIAVGVAACVALALVLVTGPARSRPAHPSCSRPDRASGA